MASRVVPEGGWSNRLKPERTPRVLKQSHIDWLKKLPCIACLASGIETFGCDPAHIRSGSRLHGKEMTGGGERPSDRWCLSLCRTHHDQQHSIGSEKNFWSMYRIDPFLLALILWGLTGNDHAAIAVIRLHARGG
jgi:hypothetical protein